ncbi:hypothetical protein SCMU_00400 [Sinomonas cyclohexanicum]|uniref:Uncharacterized protein n=1 Tax=Sinomonas cyclohexanicum TaxID=322009 RepID=A0ABM7PPQ7_SINCY|nr:hypothetical protein SCMU_00400 [Corynebacterium cyclohexanicum]
MTTGPDPEEQCGQLFERVGVVRAVQLAEDWTWTTRRGSTLRASAGDWRILDGTVSWSVKDELFPAAYEHVRGDNYKRVGLVRARQASSEETIRTLEGHATALPGDWVVTGALGEKWPVSDQDFQARYRLHGAP